MHEDLLKFELEFTEAAVGAVAEQALCHGTGARATRAIIEELLLNMSASPNRTSNHLGRSSTPSAGDAT